MLEAADEPAKVISHLRRRAQRAGSPKVSTKLKYSDT